jgi:hypothetical protein
VVAAHGGSNRYESNTGVMLRRMEFMSRPRKPAAGLSRHKPLSPHEGIGDIAVNTHQTGCVRFTHSAFPMDFSARLTRFPRPWYRC